MTWASFASQIPAARWLLEHGADINRKATFGGPDHGKGVTALHIAAQCGNAEMVKILVARGADLNLRDDLHGGSAIGWAKFAGKEENVRVTGPSSRRPGRTARRSSTWRRRGPVTGGIESGVRYAEVPSASCGSWARCGCRGCWSSVYSSRCGRGGLPHWPRRSSPQISTPNFDQSRRSRTSAST